jgi:hypothetical protein
MKLNNKKNKKFSYVVLRNGVGSDMYQKRNKNNKLLVLVGRCSLEQFVY